jgi:hypothetical protein
MKCWDGSTCLRDCLQSCKPYGVAIVPPHDGTVTVFTVGIDVHEYRKAIADDCVIGVCTVNNCLYPNCAPSGMVLTGLIVDDVAPDKYDGYTMFGHTVVKKP